MDSPSSSSQVSIEAALRVVAERQRRELGPHLETDELVDYHAGVLPEETAERVRDHLSLCPKCAGQLLDLDALHSASPDLVDADAEAAWRELAPRLVEEGEKAALVPFPRRAVSPVIPWAIAAALLLSVVGLSIRVATLGRQIHELSQPEVGAVDTYRLRPADEQVRSGEAEAPPPSSRRTVQIILLPPLDGWPAGTVELEMRGPGKELLWRHPIQPDETRDLLVTLKAGSVTPGTYRLRAYRGAGLPPVDYTLPMAR